jgi:hypothetical protein
MYSSIPIPWNIKSAPASPGRSRAGPSLYVFRLLGLHTAPVTHSLFRPCYVFITNLQCTAEGRRWPFSPGRTARGDHRLEPPQDASSVHGHERHAWQLLRSLHKDGTRSASGNCLRGSTSDLVRSSSQANARGWGKALWRLPTPLVRGQTSTATVLRTPKHCTLCTVLVYKPATAMYVVINQCCLNCCLTICSFALCSGGQVTLKK